jgi:hypothetical protein
VVFAQPQWASSSRAEAGQVRSAAAEQPQPVRRVEHPAGSGAGASSVCQTHGECRDGMPTPGGGGCCLSTLLVVVLVLRVFLRDKVSVMAPEGRLLRA